MKNEATHEDRTNSRKSKRLAHQKRLDDHQHQPLCADQSLPGIVTRLRPQLINHGPCERARYVTPKGSWHRKVRHHRQQSRNKRGYLDWLPQWLSARMPGPPRRSSALTAIIDD